MTPSRPGGAAALGPRADPYESRPKAPQPRDDALAHVAEADDRHRPSAERAARGLAPAAVGERPAALVEAPQRRERE
jgi:hypothetical protein